ncbi:MAG: CDP-diacylglycerol--serine O-phosphatidyltransferase [Ignavibacteria bacterium]|nr:CDP-diacylglycerol--serine O-phosphatidyltransferase [Ignavibacteria bacterium]
MKLRVTKSLIPNLFTVMNMFCGFLSVINSSEGNFYYASVLIILAGIFDALDGLAARITKSASEFGVELDSLSDLISFGIAPAFLIYRIKLHSFLEIGVLISAFYLITAALRLARFNVQLVGFEKTHFSGLPSPIGAMTVASFVLTFYDNSIRNFIGISGFYFVFIAIIIGFLMVSKVRYEAFPKLTREGLKQNLPLTLFMIFSLIIAIASDGKAIVFLLLIYILFGFIRSIIKSTVNILKESFSK